MTGAAVVVLGAAVVEGAAAEGLSEVGACDGVCEGGVGERDGERDGEREGDWVGRERVGECVGDALGERVGEREGAMLTGECVGDTVGDPSASSRAMWWLALQAQAELLFVSIEVGRHRGERIQRHQVALQQVVEQVLPAQRGHLLFKI